MSSRLYPGFHQCKCFITVPVCKIFIKNIYICTFAEEVLIPCFTSFICMIISGRSFQYNNICIFRNFIYSSCCTDFCLLDWICINSTRSCHNRSIISTIQIILMCSRICCDNRNSCIYKLLHIRSLSTIII